MFRIISLALGYTLGLIQTAFIIGRLSGGVDIRKHGSGNLGTTNALRVLGFKSALVVFVCDILKGVAAYTICSLMFKGSGTFVNGLSALPGIYGGLGCILGHCFPFYLKFKGGKGMASTLGVILCINPILIVSLSIVGIICVALTKYISVASLAIAALLPFGAAFLKLGNEAVLLCVLIGALSWFLHRENIKRLVNGNENKFSLKK